MQKPKTKKLVKEIWNKKILLITWPDLPIWPRTKTGLPFGRHLYINLKISYHIDLILDVVDQAFLNTIIFSIFSCFWYMIIAWSYVCSWRSKGLFIWLSIPLSAVIDVCGLFTLSRIGPLDDLFNEISLKKQYYLCNSDIFIK